MDNELPLTAVTLRWKDGREEVREIAGELGDVICISMPAARGWRIVKFERSTVDAGRVYIESERNR